MTTRFPQETVRRFDDRAEDYVKYRPSYPPDAIDAMLDGVGQRASLVAADIGAGTGISARLVADRGVRVLAVEPVAVMRGNAAPHRNVEWIDGRADATGLPSGTVDLVLSAQAFHWFKTPEAVAEFARILKPGGRLAIMWNRRSRTDPLTAGYRQAILDAGGQTADEGLGFETGVVDRSKLFSPQELLVFANTQRVDAEGLIGRARSASLTPKSGEAGQRVIDSLRALHARYADADGFVTLVYNTEVYRSHKL